MLAITVTANRALTVDPISVVAMPIPNVDYPIGTSGKHYLYTAVFTATGNNCGNDNIYYRLSITPNSSQNTSFIILDWVATWTICFVWITSDLANAGIYYITLTGYLPTIPYN